MELQRIEETLLAYIAREFLSGDGTGLTRSTPLLDLGVLDSLSVVRLMTFAETEFGIPIPLEVVSMDDMKDIARLAALVCRCSSGTA